MQVIVNESPIRVGFKHIVPFETQCFIRKQDTLIATGFASCSDSDNFERAIGRKVSLSRALRNAGFDKITRRFIWEHYFEKAEKK